MKSIRIGFVGVLFGLAACTMGPANTDPAEPSQTPPATTTPATRLSSAGQAQLRGLLEIGRLEELQWPNFSDYREQLKEFYEKAGFSTAWSNGGMPTRQALELIGILAEAEKKGLDSKDYDGERWPARVKELTAGKVSKESAIVNFDVALTVSTMRYASDLHLGKVDPRVLHTDFEPNRDEHDLSDFLLQEVVPASNVSNAFAKIEPPYQAYQLVLGELQKYLQLAREEKISPLPMVAKRVVPGQSYSAVPQLAERLKFLGDLPASATPGAALNIYQGDVVEGVRRFQERHGLEPSGQLGPQTVLELNRPMSVRLRQLRLSLERWRWVPHNFDQPPIVVNIPEFVLRAYDEQQNVKLAMRVVVGHAMRTETPVMEEDMKYVIFWPYWNVPKTILRHEIIPKIVKDRGYLQKDGFEVTTFSGELVTDGVISDELLAKLRAGKLMVRQKPGPQNALGPIKFIFPNNKDVYLHGTPAQKLFAQSRRDFSHGCIRVEEPGKLAEWVLRNNPGWTSERIDAAFAAQQHEQVNLEKAIPVLLLYATAGVSEDGAVHFFNDIYGFDKNLEDLCCQEYTSRQ